MFSPIIFLLARMMQGMSLGAESKHAFVYLLEHHSAKNHKIFACAIMTIFCSIGAILSEITCSIVSNQLHCSPESDIWRLPFLLGGTIGGIAIKMRRSLSETFHLHQPTEKNNNKSISLKDFTLTVLNFTKQYKSVVTLYLVCIWTNFTIMMLCDNFEKIIAPEILGIQMDYWVMFLEMTIFPIVLWIYRPKNYKHCLHLILKSSCLAVVFSSVAYFFVTNEHF